MADTNASPTRVIDDRNVPAPGRWQVDQVHSAVEFVVRHLMVSKVRGRFTEYEIDLLVGEVPADSTVNVVIQAASITTRDDQRDGHLKSPDFLDVENYPTLTFTSTAVAPADDEGSWTVVGDLTIKDVTRSVTLDVEFQGGAVDPWGNRRVGFTASTEIEREDYGLTWNQPLKEGGYLVGKKVKIELEVEASLSEA